MLNRFLRSRIGVTVVTLVLLSTAWTVNVTLAQPPVVESKISYQGSIVEDGVPVNGSRNLTFRFYTDAGCTTQSGASIFKNGTPVSNGFFSVELAVDRTLFEGRGLWLETTVSGMPVSCQKILPTPYAFSLRPQAVISGTSTGPEISEAVLNIQDGGSGSALHAKGQGIGVYGYSTGGVGVYGTSNASGSAVAGVLAKNTSTGFGGYFQSNGGTTLYLHKQMNSGAFIEAYNGTNRKFYVDSAGDVFADGSFNSSGADFAEMLPGVRGLEAGDVLVIGPDGVLQRSQTAHAANAIGVYSTKPGVLGGAGPDTDLVDKVPLAIVGVVPVKASTENGSIRPGDLLTTAALPGHAMRCQGVERCFGRTIGKALEGLSRETGTIQMLVMLQ